MSEKIVETVAQAIAQKQLDDGDGLYDWYALTDEIADVYRDLARAAIQAYEAAKTLDLLAGMLTHEIGADGTVNYVERDKMMGKASLHNKWLNDVINRLAERKP